MLILKTDFVGKYKVGGTNFDAVQLYIDRYEKPLLRELLGVTLFNLFETAHAADATFAADPIYKSIYDPIFADDTACKIIRMSRGMKQMLLGMVWFEFVRDTVIKMTNAGPKKDVAEVSDDVDPSFMYQRYNESVADWKTIQWFIQEHIEDYPTFNGQEKRHSTLGTMRKQTYDIIGELIASMNAVFTASSIVDNGLFNYTLPTCNTLWLNVDDVVTIGGNPYTVQSIVENVSITVQGQAAITVKTFTVANPVYRHGTIVTTNAEIKNDNDDGTKITPLIYLREGNGFLVDRMSNKQQPWDRESDLEIYFLKQNDFAKKEIDILTFGTIPMRNLAEAFIEHLNHSKNLVYMPDDYTLEDWPRFGFQASDGTKGKYFTVCDMSACKLNITAQFTRKISCCTN